MDGVGSLSLVEFLAGIPMMQGSDLYNFQGGTQTYGLEICNLSFDVHRFRNIKVRKYKNHFNPLILRKTALRAKSRPNFRQNGF